ncbi:MAG: hypothetical protein IKC52_06395, partial [Clostridia bacterium]|nr:hypothetical protein [Clostridia bacterium]
GQKDSVHARTFWSFVESTDQAFGGICKQGNRHNNDGPSGTPVPTIFFREHGLNTKKMCFVLM